MIEFEERVSKVEEVLVSFMEQTTRVLASIHEEVAEIRASNARTDRLLLEMQQQAEKDRQQAEKDRKNFNRRLAEATDAQGLLLENMYKDRQQAEKDRQQAEKDRKDFNRRLAEATDAQGLLLENMYKDRQQAEKDRQQAEKDRKDFNRRLAEATDAQGLLLENMDRDRQQAEKDRQQAEKDRKNFNRRLAEATDAQGLLIENMVWPNLKRIAAEVFRGGESSFQAIRVKRRHSGDASRMIELDLLAVGDSGVLVCEAKSKVKVEKVREFQESLQTFFEYFPEYEGKRLRPMVASVMIDPSVVEFMTSQGVLALGFGGETMDLLNPEALG